jgi:hypothetical protein
MAAEPGDGMTSGTRAPSAAIRSKIGPFCDEFLAGPFPVAVEPA